jgi:hypothetical protein
VIHQVNQLAKKIMSSLRPVSYGKSFNFHFLCRMPDHRHSVCE